LEFRLSALVDSDLAWVNGKSGRQSWRYHADAFQRSIISEAIYNFYHLSLNCKQPAICGTNLQLLQPAGIRLTHLQNVLKIHKYCRNYRVYFCPSAQDNSSSGVNNSSLRTQKRGFLRPWLSAIYLGFLIPSGLPSRILTCTELKGHWLYLF